MVEEADLDALVIAAPTTAHVALALAAIERGMPVLVEKPLAATVEEALRIVAAARGAGVPGPGRPRRALQPGGPGARPAARGRLAVERVRDRPPARRAVSGPDPRCRGDRRPRHARRRHPVLDRRRAAGPRLRRDRPAPPRSHEDLLFGLLHFPSGATGMLDVNWLTPAKRRQLVVVGEEGMFELDYLTQRLTFTRATDTANPT